MYNAEATRPYLAKFHITLYDKRSRAKYYIVEDTPHDVNESSTEVSDTVAEEIDESGLGPAGLASIGSVGLALYYYYVKGDKQRGQFVGLWPGTILGLAVYMKLGRIAELLGQTDD